jgi:uncharacterized membrane protein YfcA
MKELGCVLGLAVFYGGLAYLVSEQWLAAVGVFLVFFLVLCFFVRPLYERSAIKTRKRHECFRFVNGFLVSLAVTSSPEEAYASALSGTSKELSDLSDSLAKETVSSRLHYLSQYFLEGYYPMFLSIFALYSEQGGDLLTMAEPLLKETTRAEESANSLAKESRKKLGEFATLWLMGALIMGFLRYGLSSFYDRLANSLPYLLTTLSYFLVCLTSFVVFSLAWTHEKIDWRFSWHVQKNKD